MAYIKNNNLFYVSRICFLFPVKYGRTFTGHKIHWGYCMNVTLINLRTKNDHAFLNLGALYIAAAIRKNGHSVDFIDLVRHPFNGEGIEKHIKNNNSDLIAFSGIITAYYQLEELSNRLKAVFPDVPQLVGGSVGVNALNIIEKHTKVDFVCEGEGERCDYDILKPFFGSIIIFQL